MKHRDIASFFGGKPKAAAAAAAPGAAAAAPKQPRAKPAVPAPPAAAAAAAAGTAKKTAAAGGADGERTLKRLRRANDEGTTSAQAQQEQLEDELADDDMPQAAAVADSKELRQEEAAAAAAGAAEAAKDGGGDGDGDDNDDDDDAPAAPTPAVPTPVPPTAKPPTPADSAAAAAASASNSGKLSQQDAKAAFGRMFASPKKQPPQKQKQKQQQKQQKPPASAPAAAAKQKQQSSAGAATGDGTGGGGGDDDQDDNDAAPGPSSRSDTQQQQQQQQQQGEPSSSQQQQRASSSSPAKPKPKPKAKAAAGGGGGKKAGSGSDMEGVGQGALQAAKEAAKVDVAGAVTWPAGKPVPYSFLVDAFEEIASTTKRLEITGLLTRAFRAILAGTPGDLLAALYMCTNRVAPAHAGIELGVGDAILIKAVAQATGRKEASIKAAYEAEGDLGTVAATSRAGQRTMFAQPPLTVAAVLKTFREVAGASGKESQARKAALITKLLSGAKGSEPGYIVRSLQGRLRIGLAEQSVLIALAHAALLHREGASDRDGKLADRLEAAAQAVKQAYSECPTFDALVPALLAHPVTELDRHVHFLPGVPVRPMLAKPTVGVGEVLEKFSGQGFTCEYKYDGERVQIHVLDGGKSVRIYSRNAEDTTPRFPDIVARVKGWLKPGTESVVIDGEAVAWDPAAEKILPFQVLSTRARKEVKVEEVKVQVMVYAFDCLYHNGRSLLHDPLTARRAALGAALSEVQGQLGVATCKTSADVEELAAFLDEAVAASTEGLIVKTLDDAYEPSKRSSHWLKLKKDYLAGVGDTFDVVPIGAFHGKGKRAGVYGAYLLAVWDEDREVYQTISKLGTGFSEERLAELSEALRPHMIDRPRPDYQYGESGQPDVWFDAVAVWEVKAADLSISPLHQAACGLVEAGKGISIRFPRLVRVREDKTPQEATTAGQVAEMYRQQAVVAAGGGGAAKKDADDDEDNGDE